MHRMWREAAAGWGIPHRPPRCAPQLESCQLLTAAKSELQGGQLGSGGHGLINLGHIGARALQVVECSEQGQRLSAWRTVVGR